MPLISTDQLKKIFLLTLPETLEKYAAIFSEVLPKHGIDTPERICCFLAQVGEESNGLVATKEYSSGKQYEGREDLGNTEVGDGPKFKGRGLIQITGRGNYHACSKAMYGDDRLLEHPELMEQPQGAVDSAVWYWNDRNLSHYADKDKDWRIQAHHPAGTWDKLQWITILVNGGLSGFPQRLKYYIRAKQTFL